MDIKPSAKKTPSAAAEIEFAAEVVDNVPVAQPGTPAAPGGSAHGNPIAEGISADTVTSSNEAEMEKVLEEVNQKVKSAGNEKSEASGLRGLFHHPAQAAPPKQPVHHGSRPLLIAVIAIMVSIMLVVAAYFAFQDGKKADQPSGSTAQTDGETPSANSSATATDIDNLSQEMQNEINTLDNAQNFDSTSLSDSTLGL